MENAEIIGIKEILSLLDKEEILKLVGTSTQQLVKPEDLKSESDAIDTIIRHSTDSCIILNRKCVKREILFQYLDEKGIRIPRPITKLSLINQITSLWKNTPKSTAHTESPPEQTAPIVTCAETNADNVTLMATQFTQWFFKMLNESDSIDTEHFWQDCSLKLNLISETTQVLNSADSDRDEVVKLLCSTKHEHGLFFNPNLSADGVKGKQDAHGLVLVLVCGTLHTAQTCVGIFEQMFALARDPFSDNNWKIKNTSLTLKSREISETPKLCDTHFDDDIKALGN